MSFKKLNQSAPQSAKSANDNLLLEHSICQEMAEPSNHQSDASKTDHSYRTVVIGLALRFGKDGGTDSVPNCIMNWLWQGVLAGCPTSKIVMNWLYGRHCSSHIEVGGLPKSQPQTSLCTSSVASKGLIRSIAAERGGHYE